VTIFFPHDAWQIPIGYHPIFSWCKSPWTRAWVHGALPYTFRSMQILKAICKVISNMWFYKKLNESYSYMRKLIEVMYLILSCKKTFLHIYRGRTSTRGWEDRGLLSWVHKALNEILSNLCHIIVDSMKTCILWQRENSNFSVQVLGQPLLWPTHICLPGYPCCLSLIVLPKCDAMEKYNN
jgi:hypothetical protein